MAETILTPGKDNSSNTEQTPTINPGYLIKDNLLSEFNTEAEKSKVRENLGVLPAENIYTREDVDKIVVDKITSKLYEHVNDYDHITPEEVTDMLIDFVRNDGTTPFIAPQSGKTPTSDSHLTTKAYVDRLILNCLKLADKTKILELVTNILRDYTKYEDVYTKDQVYTKDLVDNKNTKYVRIDGTTPFESPQSGRTPQISSHLTTKGYVDNLLTAHKEDIDPHGFSEKLNNRLRKYVLKENIYDRTLTYSRGQIDLVIDKLVTAAVEEAFRSHEDLDDPHGILDRVKQLGYIHKDGSIAFTSPLRGIDAVNPLDLVTLHQVEDKIDKRLENIDQLMWSTSGPVETTVGFIEDNTLLPEKLSFLEVMDAIFYGKRIKLDAPDVVPVGTIAPITVCIQGTLESIQNIEVYLGELFLYTITREELSETGCYTIDSLPINSDLNISIKVFYTNGTMFEIQKVIKVSLPIFVGINPRWRQGYVLTYDMLEEMTSSDPDNNKFYYEGKDLKLIEHSYNFDEDKELKIIVVIPVDYSNLIEMANSALVVTSSAFEVVDMIPFRIPGMEKDVVYKIYTYKQDLYSLNTTMKFKFE